MSENATIPTVELTTSASPDAPTAHISTFIQRPEWVPEKFYDSKTGAVDLKNVLKSYGELEKVRSAGEPKPEPVAEGAPKPEVSEQQVTTPPPVEILIQVPGVDNNAMKSYSAEIQKDGKLSDASYESLVKAGYSKPVVDAYLNGITAEQSSAQAVQQARIADTEIASITESIGGKAALNEMQAWARSSMSPADLSTYNEAVSSGNVAKVRLAVAGLHYTFTKAHGQQPNYLPSGRLPQGTADVYASSKEATSAIKDPRYHSDPAYRELVAAKLGRSNIM